MWSNARRLSDDHDGLLAYGRARRTLQAAARYGSQQRTDHGATGTGVLSGPHAWQMNCSVL